ncbi:MAG: HD domain-containing protein [Spirochaetaceae bacterium]|jgi:putative two-component system response regulator|nr:HD domain-containing protein [Spirochaetaceae bacterium]
MATIQKEPYDELEPLEEFEELEEIPKESFEPEPEDGETSKFFSSTLNPFLNSVFPVLFIDNKFKILYANPSCEHLFTGFLNLAGKYFIDIFGKFFEMSAIREIRETILQGNNGYSWKGEARIKSREMATVQTRVYLFSADLNIKRPREFVVMFDDVTEENKRLLRSVFMSLLEASKLKDNDTGKHIIRVNYYSRCLAEELYHKAGYDRIDADFIDNIGFLASMHDVGKIGTPDDILNKEGPLSDWEWTVMREHTKNGAFILSTYPNPMAKEIALSHHERWNGSGYPFQLEGEMIPLAARIVSIADVYDALRMERAYKAAFSHEVTVQKMIESKGTQFDPSLLDVFLTVNQEFNSLYEQNKD